LQVPTGIALICLRELIMTGYHFGRANQNPYIR